MSEEHKQRFNGEIKIKFLEDDDCEYSGIPGLVAIELDHNYRTEAKWIGEEEDFESGLQEIGRAYTVMRMHWERRRQNILKDERMQRKPSIVEASDLGEETDEHKVEL